MVKQLIQKQSLVKERMVIDCESLMLDIQQDEMILIHGDITHTAVEEELAELQYITNDIQ